MGSPLLQVWQHATRIVYHHFAQSQRDKHDLRPGRVPDPCSAVLPEGASDSDMEEPDVAVTHGVSVSQEFISCIPYGTSMRCVQELDVDN